MFLDVAIQFRHIQYIIILSYIHSVIIFDAYICLQVVESYRFTPIWVVNLLCFSFCISARRPDLQNLFKFPAGKI